MVKGMFQITWDCDLRHLYTSLWKLESLKFIQQRVKMAIHRIMQAAVV